MVFKLCTMVCEKYGRTPRKGTGGCNSAITMFWVTGQASCFPTYLKVQPWLSGEVRLWTQSRMDNIPPRKWGVAISPKKVLGKPVTLRIFRLLMVPTISGFLKALPLSPSNPTATMYNSAKVAIGGTTFIMVALVEALAAPEVLNLIIISSYIKREYSSACLMRARLLALSLVQVNLWIMFTTLGSSN